MGEYKSRMERYCNSVAHDELGYRVSGIERELRSRIESIREECITYEELEDLRLELLERQNKIFRALARELRRVKQT